MKEDDEEEVLPTYIYLYSISMLCMYVLYISINNTVMLSLTTTYYLIHIHGDIQSVPNTLVTCKSLH